MYLRSSVSSIYLADVGLWMFTCKQTLPKAVCNQKLISKMLNLKWFDVLRRLSVAEELGFCFRSFSLMSSIFFWQNLWSLVKFDNKLSEKVGKVNSTKYLVFCHIFHFFANLLTQLMSNWGSEQLFSNKTSVHQWRKSLETNDCL